MKTRLVDSERAVTMHDQSSEIAEPSDGALDDPAALVGRNSRPPWVIAPIISEVVDDEGAVVCSP